MVDPLRADCHTHSSASDGSYSPEELCQEALAVGLAGLSITDHDTVAAYDQLRVPDGLTLLPGVEVTTDLEGSSVHLLAYGFSLDDKEIREMCRQRLESRRERFMEMRQRLQEQGLRLDPNRTWTQTALGRPQLAQELIEMGVCRSYQEAFTKYLHDHAPAYVPGRSFATLEAIQQLQAANAYVILAHPMLVDRKKLPKLMAMPLDGLEVWYGHSRGSWVSWMNLAMERHWLMTGGSDFHGAAKPDQPLGASWTPWETFQRLCEGRR
ncbi:MAG: PHP domain-containing protein [Chlamydiia bacterium]